MRLFDDVASRVIDPYLRRALELAEHGRGATSPNPLVGCVVVRDGQVVGEGFHPRAGEPHAEVFALGHAGDKARGATAYVTLEPCDHHGKTPPCTDALIAAGVSRVVVGMPDPNPKAAQGARRLLDAGIEVDFAADQEPFESINEGWLKRMATGVPFVAAKVALSLDARPAFELGSPATLTGEAGARVTRVLRAQADAVLVGAATVISDDPELTVRDEHGVRAERQPLRVVVAHRRVPAADARVFTDGLAPTLLLVASDCPDDAPIARLGSEVLVERFDTAEGIDGVLKALGRRGIGDLLIEPGPRLLTSLWAAGALDALVTVTAGGMAGPGAPAVFSGEPDRESGKLVHRFAPAEAGIVGDVSVTVWRPRGADAG